MVAVAGHLAEQVEEQAALKPPTRISDRLHFQGIEVQVLNKLFNSAAHPVALLALDQRLVELLVCEELRLAKRVRGTPNQRPVSRVDGLPDLWVARAAPVRISAPIIEGDKAPIASRVRKQ